MKRDKRNVSRCRLCGTTLRIPPDVEPRLMTKGVDGDPNERGLSVDGREIHRCEARPETS